MPPRSPSYEVAGIFTNLAAGMMGARWGIKTTLLTGLCVELVALGMLFGWQVRYWHWTAAEWPCRGG